MVRNSLAAPGRNGSARSDRCSSPDVQKDACPKNSGPPKKEVWRRGRPLAGLSQLLSATLAHNKLDHERTEKSAATRLQKLESERAALARNEPGLMLPRPNCTRNKWGDSDSEPESILTPQKAAPSPGPLLSFPRLCSEEPLHGDEPACNEAPTQQNLHSPQTMAPPVYLAVFNRTVGDKQMLRKEDSNIDLLAHSSGEQVLGLTGQAPTPAPAHPCISTETSQPQVAPLIPKAVLADQQINSVRASEDLGSAIAALLQPADTASHLATIEPTATPATTEKAPTTQKEASLSQGITLSALLAHPPEQKKKDDANNDNESSSERTRVLLSRELEAAVKRSEALSRRRRRNSRGLSSNGRNLSRSRNRGNRSRSKTGSSNSLSRSKSKRRRRRSRSKSRHQLGQNRSRSKCRRAKLTNTVSHRRSRSGRRPKR